MITSYFFFYALCGKLIAYARGGEKVGRAWPDVVDGQVVLSTNYGGTFAKISDDFDSVIYGQFGLARSRK